MAFTFYDQKIRHIWYDLRTAVNFRHKIHTHQHTYKWLLNKYVDNEISVFEKKTSMERH